MRAPYFSMKNMKLRDQNRYEERKKVFCDRYHDILYTQKLHTSVYINDHALYSFTFYSFYHIFSCVAFSLFSTEEQQTNYICHEIWSHFI